MIKITKMSRELTDVEQYLMTISSAITSCKDLDDGTKITVDAYLEFEDTKEDSGEVNDILSILTPDKKAFSCQSSTFKRSLNDIKTIMKDKTFTIIKTSGKTKAGRDYINCELDVDSLL